ncbi:MAG: hypothetical protein Q6J68_02475 [Thermostichales cyanobacterium SZTDM-1c_bins_54]
MARRQHAHNAQKIDLHQQYPCPCCSQGRLQHIILTESLGCPHCQQIFALHSDGLHIEQLAVSQAYRKVWLWNGRQWRVARAQSGLGVALLGMIALSSLIFGIVILLARLGWGLDTLGWTIVLILCIGLGCLLGVVLLRS